MYKEMFKEVLTEGSISPKEFSNNVKRSQENMDEINRLIFEIEEVWRDKQRSVGGKGAVQLVKETEDYIESLETVLKKIKKI